MWSTAQGVSEEKARISTSLIFLLSGGVQQIPPLVSTLQLELHTLKGHCLKVEEFMDTWGTHQGTALPKEAAASSHCVFGKVAQRSDRVPTGVRFPGTSYHWTADSTWTPQYIRLEPLTCKPTERYSSWRWLALLTGEVRNHRLPEAVGCVLHMQREERNAVPIIFLLLF